MRFVRIYPSIGYLLVYLVALGVERLARPEVSGLAFFWPATGIAALWLLSGRTRRRVALDGGLLLLGTVVLDVLLGLDLAPALLFGLATLAVGLTVRLASALLEGLPFGGPLPRRISRSSDLWGVGIAALAGALASAGPGLAGVYAESGSLSWGLAGAWVVRNACSTFVVVAAVLGLLTTVFRAHAKRGWGALLTPYPRRLWATELVTVAVVSVAMGIVVFGSTKALPIAFVMIVASTWVGARFSPAVGGVYIAVLSSLAALCTQVGRGPFGPIDDLVTRSIIVQAYVLVTAIIVLMLSLGAYERAALFARVRESEARATDRADLVDAVTTVMHDGLVVVDVTGRILLSNPAAERLAGIGGSVPQLGSPEQHGLFRLDGTVPPTEELPRARALRGEFVAPTDLLRIDPETGQQRVLAVSAMPLHQAEADAPAAAVLVMHDVTKVRAQRRDWRTSPAWSRTT